jgi:valyl-tRNA synthetase
MAKQELAKIYDFKGTEQRIYDWWERQGYFKPWNDPRNEDFDPKVKPFVIAMPPPNITGRLHMGHAITSFTEDLMVRYHRMRGEPTLWVPGSDHASIATQLQVEKALRDEGSSREAIGREAFLERAWQWREDYGRQIVEQTRRLGASCDWSRERFTMDEGLSKAVNEAFVRLYEKGLIYRGPRLINWSPGLKTAVSDLEVEYSEEPGKLYYFKYRIKGSEGFIPVATTRPETILADTAVAVHPDDERFAAFVGQTALVPILDREIPIIADDYVDREFGTGALKITPGHDPNDYAIGQRHDLPLISMLDKEACITEAGGPYAGLDRFEGREKLWVDMQAAGLTIKVEEHTQRVPRAQRGGEIVEPMISTQWFVEIQPLADKALQAVEGGHIELVPPRFTKIYRNWMENIEDWCISRQLWWGHRIPVWYTPDGEMFAARDEDEAYEQARAKLGADVTLEQDPDVLDTWFSAALWPFSTLGWPQETPDLDYFYPTTVMETGYDILFFWVARMIMGGLEFTEEIPFETVYLHGMIRDAEGRKMSKTLGNVMDPIDVMDEYGTDALRFTLLVGSTPGQDTNLSLEKVEGNRNFVNKLWNAARFLLGALPAAPKAAEGDDLDWTLADSWIWARAKQLTRDVERLFDGFQFGEAGRQIYDFFWSDFADWYIEIAKGQLAAGGDRAFKTAGLLVRLLDLTLRLLHPFIPFVSEEIWGHLKAAASKHAPNLNPEKEGQWPEALIVAEWPQAIKDKGWEAERLAEFEVFREVVRSIRNLRAEKNVKPGTKLGALVASRQHAEMLAQEAGALAALAALDPAKLEINAEMGHKPEGHVALVAGPVEIYLPLAEMVDPAEERARLQSELAETLQQIQRLEGLLASDFARKAPKAVVEKERGRLTEFQDSADRIAAQLNAMKE